MSHDACTADSIPALPAQVKHLERKTDEVDVPYSDVARYLQDKLHSTHSASGSGRMGGSGVHSSGSLVRLGSRLDMRSLSIGIPEGNSDDDEDPRARRRRR